jgi:hypothetical protein
VLVSHLIEKLAHRVVDFLFRLSFIRKGENRLTQCFPARFGLQRPMEPVDGIHRNTSKRKQLIDNAVATLTELPPPRLEVPATTWDD